jgi:hypothetical protein
MTGWVGRLVKVDHTGIDIRLQVTFQGGATGGDWGEVTSSNEDY